MKCVRIDREALIQLFSISHKYDGGKQIRLAKSEYWSRYFDVSSIIEGRKNLYFDNSIQTNGPYTIFQFIVSDKYIDTDLPKKIEKRNVSCTTGKQFKIATINDNIRKSVENNEFDVITAIDIGFNNMAGTTTLNLTDKSESSYNFKSKWFRSIAGFHWQKLERERITQLVINCIFFFHFNDQI